MSAHEVLFDLEFLVQRTLQQQHPELAKSAAAGRGWPSNGIDKTPKQQPANQPDPAQRRSLVEENAASRMQEIFPQSITITPVLKRKGSEESRSDSKRRRGEEGDEVVINGDNHSEEVVKCPSECEPSWSLGCLYRCAICGVKFQTLTSFQSHLFFHRITPEQYLAQHGGLNVMFQQHMTNVQNHFLLFQAILGCSSSTTRASAVARWSSRILFTSAFISLHTDSTLPSTPACLKQRVEAAAAILVRERW